MNANRKSNLWTTGLITVVVLILLSFWAASCGTLGIGPGWSAVDPSSLPPEVAAHALPTEVPIPATEPERNYVVVRDEDVPDGVAAIDLGEVPDAPDVDWSDAAAGALGSVGSMLGPWGVLAGSLVAKLLASKRGRRHGANALALAGKGKPVEAVKGILAAEGWLDSKRVAGGSPTDEQAPTTPASRARMSMPQEI